MSNIPKPCGPVSCPSFEETTLVVERCPTCGEAYLKWYPDQPIDCEDDFHNTGLKLQ